MSDLLCVSAADTAHTGLLFDLVSSFRSHPAGRDRDWAVLDAGLDDESVRRVVDDGIKVLKPDWYVDRDGFTFAPPAYMRALQALPFLPQAFPGYQYYLYMDADVWVQDWAAISLYLSAAAEHGFAVTPELHRSYPPVANFHVDLLSKRFGHRIARRLGLYPEVNAGVFCGRVDSAVWPAWQALVRSTYADLRAGRVNPYRPGTPRWLWHRLAGRIARAPVAADFYLNQVALTRLVYLEKAPAALLPSWCNWVCHAALPAVAADQQTLCEPQPPYRALGLVHLTGDTKRRSAVELRKLGGGSHTRSLRYSGAAATP